MMAIRTGCVLIGVLALAGAAFGQNFSGTYTMSSGTTKLTLVLDQGSGSRVSGTLSSSTGTVFRLTGEIEEDTVLGTCQGQAGTSQFEASFEGALLIFTLIETGPTGEVTSRSLEFVRAAGEASPSAELGLPPAEPGPAAPKAGGAGPRPAPAQPARPAQAAPRQPSGGGNAVSAPEMGIAFAIPTGWNSQKQDDAIYLTSTSYKGFILIQRHSYDNLQQMASEASQGIVDESSNTRLMPVSGFQAFGSNGLAAEFSGMAQGRQAHTFAIGLISPQGGGVTIMAVTESASYTQDYPGFVRSIAGSLSFMLAGPAGGPQIAGPQAGAATDTSLMSYFAGEWYSHSSGSTIYGGAGTERTMTLCPDGFYRDSSEFSASGGGWGGANAQSGWGRWSIQGDKIQGVIFVTYPDGRTKRLPYRIVSKEEQTINFDGIVYVFAGKPKCR
jgi:hypothetical protein